MDLYRLLLFLDIEVDTSRRLIYRGGKKVKIATLNYDLLVYLLNNPNKIISREELKENVWRGRVVSDATVYKQIKRLKQGFLDSLSNNEILQTVHGQGVMFVADVKTIESNQMQESKLKTVVETKKPVYLRVGYFLFASTIILIFIFLIIQVKSIKQENFQLSKKIDRLAILYQKNDANPEKSMDAHVMAQALRAQMLVSNNLKVNLEKTQSNDFLFNQVSTNLIQKLGYDHVLNVQISTHEFGVKGHVLLSKGLEIYPATTFEATSNFLLIKDISNWVLEQLQKNQDENVLLSELTVSESAFEDYLAAIRYTFDDKPNLSIELLKQAVTKDPNFSTAWDALGGRLMQLGEIEQAYDILTNIDLTEASERLKLNVFNNIAGCYYRLGQLENALSVLDDAIAIAEKLGDHGRIIMILTNQSLLHLSLGLTDVAQEKLEQALQFIDEDYLKKFLAVIYLHLGTIHQKKFEAGKSLYYFEQSYKSSLLSGRKLHANLAMSLWSVALLNNAEFEKAYNMAQKVPDTEVIAELSALQTLITIELEGSDIAGARARLDSYKIKLENIESFPLISKYLELEYTYLSVKNDYIGAKKILEQMKLYASSTEYPAIGQSLSLMNLDYTLTTSKQVISAKESVELTEHLVDQAELSLAKAKIFAHNHQNKKAFVSFEKAMSIFQKNNQKFKLLKSLEAYFDLIKQSGETPPNSQHWLLIQSTLPEKDFAFLHLG